MDTMPMPMPMSMPKNRFNHTRRRNKRGGIPIFAGAQGCIFKPSLKCKDRVRNYHDGNISKLGEKTMTEDEMREYQQIRRHLSRIKHHDKYFSMQASLCEPDALDRHDLENFDKVCINMKRHNITAANVNSNLRRLRMINMPDLGIDLKEWMDRSVVDANHIHQLNDHVSTLLVHAVAPMNRLGVIHNDLKSDNVMIDAMGNARIIDWGLAGVSTATQVVPPHHFMNNPVTFNRPFSTMVISPQTCELYASAVLSNASNPTMVQIKHFTRTVYKQYIKTFDIQSYEYFQYIFMCIFGLKEKAASERLIDAVTNYNAEILHHFTDHVNRSFRLNEYFSTVYRFNTDVWGLMSTFYDMFTLPRKQFIMPDAVYAEMLHRYRTLFSTVIFANGHKRIDVSHILKELARINAMVDVRSPQKTVRFHRMENSRFRKSIKRVPTPYPYPRSYSPQLKFPMFKK